jgi:hypothetical protein
MVWRCLCSSATFGEVSSSPEANGCSVYLRWRGTQKEKGRVCKALFGGSIPSRASTSLYVVRVLFALGIRFETTIFLRIKTVAWGLSL